jgi:hypothetical protein
MIKRLSNKRMDRSKDYENTWLDGVTSQYRCRIHRPVNRRGNCDRIRNWSIYDDIITVIIMWWDRSSVIIRLPPVVPWKGRVNTSFYTTRVARGYCVKIYNVSTSTAVFNQRTCIEKVLFLILFEWGPEFKIGRGDHASTGAGYKVSRTKSGLN